MQVPKQAKKLFEPSALKISLFLLILLYAYYLVFFHRYYPWGHSFSPLPILLFNPVYSLWSLLILPYSYLISCLLASIVNPIKKKKRLILPVLVLLLLVLGLDEPAINSTVNRPDYACITDTDCTLKSITKGFCGTPRCVNNGWQYYDSIANSVLALDCLPINITCSCIDNVCVGS
jgi:hypothetical protein